VVSPAPAELVSPALARVVSPAPAEQSPEAPADASTEQPVLIVTPPQQAAATLEPEKPVTRSSSSDELPSAADPIPSDKGGDDEDDTPTPSKVRVASPTSETSHYSSEEVVAEQAGAVMEGTV
jgi:hypothetical protein